MTYKGHVKNGVVVLDGAAALSDGEEVRISVVRPRSRARRRAERPTTLLDELRPILGKARGLPPDAARNHDHYLYGLPKK